MASQICNEMESRTFLEAAATGNVNYLHSLPDTAKKQLAKVPNQDGFSPLHLASANGHLQFVLELLKLDPSLCDFEGSEQRLPVHCAVVEGRIDVMKKLLSERPDSIESTTARGETLLHLAVKNNQFHALKLLVEHVKLFEKELVLNQKDSQGNTLLHLATSRKQYEVVNLLLASDEVTKQVMEVNTLNEAGMSALDVMLFQGEAGDSEIYTTLVKAGAKSGKEGITNTANLPTRIRYWPRLGEVSELFGYRHKKDSINDVRGALLTVAALMATATYQAVLSPPGGLWQDDNNGHSAGTSIMATKHEGVFLLFILCNSIGFYSSFHMIFWLTINFPLQYPLLLLLITISITYSASMISIVPDHKSKAHKFELISTTVAAIGFGLLVPLLPSIVRRLDTGPLPADRPSNQPTDQGQS